MDTGDQMEDFIGLATHSIDNFGSICMYLQCWKIDKIGA